MTKYPWKIGDLALYFEDNITARKLEDGKNAVIVGFHNNLNFKLAEILVDGKVLVVSFQSLQIPPVKKVKTNFGIKK